MSLRGGDCINLVWEREGGREGGGCVFLSSE